MYCQIFVLQLPGCVQGTEVSMEKRKIFVIGHKNPDTDSVCSAIAYAQLKNEIDTENEYIPLRAGQTNEETQYVLKQFGVNAPQYVMDVKSQVKDIEIRKVDGVDRNISIKAAWKLMRDIGVVTLPITRDNKLEGLITIADIATSYMDVHDSTTLSTARTVCKNIVETLDGALIIGDEEHVFDRGKVLVAAANPDLMESYIRMGDIVILGNRYESQLCAIEMQAGCIVVCEGAPVSMTIKKLAVENHCTIISTPHDTFTASRLINQSVPISFFMRTEGLITFSTEAYTDEVRQVMAKKRHRDFPIHDEQGNYIGMISRRNLLGMGKKQIIMVDHNEAKQAVDGIDQAEILEIIDHHKLGAVETMNPVFFRNQPLGCTATIIYQMYGENHIKINKKTAGLMCSAILSDTLMFRSPTCTPADVKAARALAELAGIDIEGYAVKMFRAGSNLKDKTPQEIFSQDYKRFSVNDINFGVGQISSMDEEELMDIKDKIMPYMEEQLASQGINMIFFMLTNMIATETLLIALGNGAGDVIENGFDAPKLEENVYRLEGVVSRKKQLIPEILTVLSQE